MDLYEAIKTRKSVRKFQNLPAPPTERKAVIVRSPAAPAFPGFTPLNCWIVGSTTFAPVNDQSIAGQTYQPEVPGAPLNGPTISSVIQPP